MILAMPLFLARFPGGQSLIVNAESLEGVADVVDEVADPGECEVSEYQGPLVLRCQIDLSDDDNPVLALSNAQVDASEEMLKAVIQAAYPAVAKLYKQKREPRRTSWERAIDQECERELRTDAAWGRAVTRWWEEFSGAPADRSAALRQHAGVTIPGEPKVVTAAQQALFDAANRRATEAVARALLTPPPTPRGKKTAESDAKGAKPRNRRPR